MSELLKINVNDHIEKKNNLSYLSWAWAWAEVLKIDAQATWEAVEFNGLPCTFLPDSSALVKVLVTIKGHSKTCWLPVMNHRNQAIKNPDAFAINTAIVRCLTKCISMHGLGLYIYAGEDLPEDDKQEPVKVVKQAALSHIGDEIPDDWKAYLEGLSADVMTAVAAGAVNAAKSLIEDAERDNNLDETHMLYLQSKLNPAARKALGFTYVKAA